MSRHLYVLLLLCDSGHSWRLVETINLTLCSSSVTLKSKVSYFKEIAIKQKPVQKNAKPYKTLNYTEIVTWKINSKYVYSFRQSRPNNFNSLNSNY